jgi:integrase
VEKHAEGRYYMSHNGQWIDAGTDALVILPGSPGRITLAAAAEKYFANCEARGLDIKSIRKYRAAVDPFVQHCGVTYVDECRDNKQVLLNYMGWLRKQPVSVRKRSDGSSSNNPKRTLANRVSDVRIFLKSLGVSKLLAKHEEPTYHEKKVVAHTDDELSVLYGAADAEETSLLDFFIGTMARDHEAYGCRYRDLTGTTLTLYGKRDKTRTVEISQRLSDAINARRKRLGAGPNDLLFANRSREPRPAPLA